MVRGRGDKVQRILGYWLCSIRHEEGMNSIWAPIWNLGSWILEILFKLRGWCYCDQYREGKGTNGNPMRPNTDAVFSGGLDRSSDEVSVMEMERRV